MTFVLILLFGLVISLWNSFVISKLWAWFVVTAFTTAPRLAALQIYGLLLVFDVIKFKPDTKDEKREDVYKRAVSSVIQNALYALVCLGLGALVHKMMLP